MDRKKYDGRLLVLAENAEEANQFVKEANVVGVVPFTEKDCVREEDTKDKGIVHNDICNIVG